MNDVAIKIENLSKQYRLGVVGTGTLSHDLQRWWITNILGREDPYLKIGETNTQASKGSSEYVWALRDINLEVKQGEILGIIGKNGAGKSTMLKILSRVTKPTTGSITYKGRIASLLEVGTGFHPEMTGRENIYMNGTIMGMTRAEINQRLDEIIDFAGVERYIDTPVKRYSSGMKVRLGFAIAAHLEPEILVVDEVLAVGDAEFQKKAIGKMQDVSTGEGRTVLFVSHNMASVKALCTKGLILNNGKVLVDGDVSGIINEYLSSFSIDLNGNFTKNKLLDDQMLWIEDAYVQTNSKRSEAILCGQDCDFIVHYGSNTENISAGCFIGIYNVFGEKLFHLGTQYSDSECFYTKTKGTIICRIPRIPLIKGQYVVNISLTINGIQIDRIKNAFSFIIENGDFYGNGKLPNTKENKFLVEQQWTSL